MEHRITDKKNELTKHGAKLDALNPLSVLTRGYTAVFNENNQIVSSINQVTPDQILTLRFTKGSVKTKVLQVEGKDD